MKIFRLPDSSLSAIQDLIAYEKYEFVMYFLSQLTLSITDKNKDNLFFNDNDEVVIDFKTKKDHRQLIIDKKNF